ncbi:26S Proteasome non-ATPase regulatory subunit 9, putative [Eimeria mitis]|uniref:26S Proteasome non-ATPase regulatory subunit 9, putative n=1 Tax=Eimeria mitis TaxID=44415 RepID=U6JQY5_9EIME|nr:26S Proteasome non-ATPase regulatory subunit 9, putative [Eimeria mitis]CDJ27829.1 26S Proteasome non-ATPase regulatory subunit 9, putative [Eimeria mitis]
MQNGVGSSLAAEAEEVYRQRQQVEERMEALASFLTSDGMPGLDGPLVDEEGFPRADIDVHAVRDARHRLACLKTDYQKMQYQFKKRKNLLSYLKKRVQHSLRWTLCIPVVPAVQLVSLLVIEFCVWVHCI